MLEKTIVSRMNTNFDTFTSDADKENLRKTEMGDGASKDIGKMSAGDRDDDMPERQVSEDDILEFSKRTGLSVFEASAKTGNGVESSFISLTEALIEKKQANQKNVEEP